MLCNLFAHLFISLHCVQAGSSRVGPITGAANGPDAHSKELHKIAPKSAKAWRSAIFLSREFFSAVAKFFVALLTYYVKRRALFSLSYLTGCWVYRIDAGDDLWRGC